MLTLSLRSDSAATEIFLDGRVMVRGLMNMSQEGLETPKEQDLDHVKTLEAQPEGNSDRQVEQAHAEEEAKKTAIPLTSSPRFGEAHSLQGADRSIIDCEEVLTMAAPAPATSQPQVLIGGIFNKSTQNSPKSDAFSGILEREMHRHGNHERQKLQLPEQPSQPTKLGSSSARPESDETNVLSPDASAALAMPSCSIEGQKDDADHIAGSQVQTSSSDDPNPALSKKSLTTTVPSSQETAVHAPTQVPQTGVLRGGANSIPPHYLPPVYQQPTAYQKYLVQREQGIQQQLHLREQQVKQK